MRNLIALLLVVGAACTVESTQSTQQALGDPGFVISTSPTMVNIAETGQASFTVNVAPYNGYTGSVTLSPVGLPANTTASFSPQPVAIVDTNSVNATMTLTTAGATDGAYTIDVSGTDGTISSLSSNCCANLQVGPTPDWALAVSPSSISVHRGQAAVYSDTLTANSAFSGTVSMSASNQPAHTTTTFSPASFTLAPSGVGNGTVTIQTASNTPRGTYNVTVTSQYAFSTHSATVALVVQ